MGTERLQSSSQFLANDMAEMFEGLLDFIAYESIVTTSAQQKVAACVVEEGDTVHSLNMAEDEDFDTWKGRRRTTTTDDDDGNISKTIFKPCHHIEFNTTNPNTILKITIWFTTIPQKPKCFQNLKK